MGLLNLRRRMLLSTNVKSISNLFDYNLTVFARQNSAYPDVVEQTSNSVTVSSNPNTSATASYFYAENILELKPNTTYTSKCTVILEDNVSPNLGAAGSMACSMFCQDNKTFSSTKFKIVDAYAVSNNGKNVGTYEVYTTFTTPNDLTSYKYIVVRASKLTSLTFKDLILVEGDSI